VRIFVYILAYQVWAGHQPDWPWWLFWVAVAWDVLGMVVEWSERRDHYKACERHHDQ
jgi:hypothetical protein